MENKEEKLVFLSLERLERKMDLVEAENRELKREISKLKENPKEEEERNYRESSIEALEMRNPPEEPEEVPDRWREIQRKYQGKAGTLNLKKWCTKKGIPYKNKHNALMAVHAHEAKNT